MQHQALQGSASRCQMKRASPAGGGGGAPRHQRQHAAHVTCARSLAPPPSPPAPSLSGFLHPHMPPPLSLAPPSLPGLVLAPPPPPHVPPPAQRDPAPPAAPPPAAEATDAGPAHADRVAGCLLGLMAGSALGQPLHHERHYRITRMMPHGLGTPFNMRLDPAQPPPGTTSGEVQAALATARALVREGGADLDAIIAAIVTSFQPASRDYAPYTRLTAEALSQGADPTTLASQLDACLDLTYSRAATTTSDRPEREPWGQRDNGAALRALPVGLAYAAAPPAALAAAVDVAVAFTHPHPQGRDAAGVAAAAVAWLAAAPLGTASPADLLGHLLDVAETPDMVGKLATVAAALRALGGPLPAAGAGRRFWASREWAVLTTAAARVTRSGYATLGPEAVAVALLALGAAWGRPAQAVEVAVALGGSCGATAPLTGALAGALHGREWVPQNWWAILEDAPLSGKSAAGALAEELALLRCTEAPHVPLGLRRALSDAARAAAGDE